MKKPPAKYRRCKKCKELIAAHHDDCPNCANLNPLGWRHFKMQNGQVGRPTLDIQEGNDP